MLGAVPALIASDGPLRGQRFEVDDEVYVGREGDGVTLDDPELSRRHAVLRASQELVTIEDLGSRNGTFVNGKRIDSVTTIGHGDVVKLGATSFDVDISPVDPGLTVVSPTPRVQAPNEPFGAYAAADVTSRRRRKVASRQLVPELVSVVAVVTTAAALILYFALR
jgi:pSer/pThr/pTyr-binding forkhead associated (FHA) protein